MHWLSILFVNPVTAAACASTQSPSTYSFIQQCDSIPYQVKPHRKSLHLVEGNVDLWALCRSLPNRAIGPQFTLTIRRHEPICLGTEWKYAVPYKIRLLNGPQASDKRTRPDRRHCPPCLLCTCPGGNNHNRLLKSPDLEVKLLDWDEHWAVQFQFPVFWWPSTKTKRNTKRPPSW